MSQIPEPATRPQRPRAHRRNLSASMFKIAAATTLETIPELSRPPTPDSTASNPDCDDPPSNDTIIHRSSLLLLDKFQSLCTTILSYAPPTESVDMAAALYQDLEVHHQAVIEWEREKHCGEMEGVVTEMEALNESMMAEIAQLRDEAEERECRLAESEKEVVRLQVRVGEVGRLRKERREVGEVMEMLQGRVRALEEAEERQREEERRRRNYWWWMVIFWIIMIALGELARRMFDTYMAEAFYPRLSEGPLVNMGYLRMFEDYMTDKFYPRLILE